MIDKKVYEEEICKYCKNENCKENIKTENKLDIVIGQLCTTTTMKCENYICKNEKRRNKNESKSDR